mmetsp:Transcript_111753/g.360719  ORF Transcript_111753/g.360719 Transcript_111753/m.360719 type:complete len:393 (-) Transcript_111753:169-1347(-)
MAGVAKLGRSARREDSGHAGEPRIGLLALRRHRQQLRRRGRGGEAAEPTLGAFVAVAAEACRPGAPEGRLREGREPPAADAAASGADGPRPAAGAERIGSGLVLAAADVGARGAGPVPVCISFVQRGERSCARHPRGPRRSACCERYLRRGSSGHRRPLERCIARAPEPGHLAHLRALPQIRRQPLLGAGRFVRCSAHSAGLGPGHARALGRRGALGIPLVPLRGLRPRARAVLRPPPRHLLLLRGAGPGRAGLLRRLLPGPRSGPGSAELPRDCPRRGAQQRRREDQHGGRQVRSLGRARAPAERAAERPLVAGLDVGRPGALALVAALAQRRGLRRPPGLRRRCRAGLRAPPGALPGGRPGHREDGILPRVLPSLLCSWRSPLLRWRFLG